MKRVRSFRKQKEKKNKPLEIEADSRPADQQISPQGQDRYQSIEGKTDNQDPLPLMTRFWNSFRKRTRREPGRKSKLGQQLQNEEFQMRMPLGQNETPCLSVGYTDGATSPQDKEIERLKGQSTHFQRQIEYDQNVIKQKDAKIEMQRNEIVSKDKQIAELQQQLGELKKPTPTTPGKRRTRSCPPVRHNRTDVRCLVLMDGRENVKFASAREAYIAGVKSSLSEKGLSLHTTPIAPSALLSEQKAATLTQPLLLILPCLVSARLDSCIRNVMERNNIKYEHKRLLVMFHPRAPHDAMVARTRQQVAREMLSQMDVVVDVVFDRQTTEIIFVKGNSDPVFELTDYLMKIAHTPQYV